MTLIEEQVDVGKFFGMGFRGGVDTAGTQLDACPGEIDDFGF